MPLAAFESTIPVFKRAKAFHALDRAAIVTGIFYMSLIYNKIGGLIRKLMSRILDTYSACI
jgi:hypothetical protein